ncbi:Nudix hydrolase 14, chloroplastic [Pleurostoma richardsiae]|uniref:Nudix hydrolase 14, chloroplastic n=1 Tax=Pleurostoma richardsiae TaxID=41990 RepID=A0AA38VW52_9PEZI|nr:Nudix hydrolase 14, chloroplastic [Pleurostoma richardsiae]
MASTFTLQEHDIPVTLPEGLTESQLLSFHPFKTWIKTLTSSLSLQARDPSHPFHADPYRLRSVSIQSFDLFGSGDSKRLGFLKLNSDVSNAAGEHLPGSVFLRGPAVAMLVILVPDDVGSDGAATDHERHVLLTVQPRVAAGSLAFAEIPAGMVDEEGQFAGTAANEIREELGLDIPASELRCLSEMALPGPEEGGGAERERLPRGVYPSPGGCDEYIPIYVHERRVPREQLAEWTGKLTGLRDEGEKITLKLVRMRDLWREGARDGKTLAALALWEGLRREGKL